MKSILLFSIICLSSFLKVFCQEVKPKTEKIAFTPDDIKQILKENKTVILDFYATWCGPCVKMEPTIEKLKKDLKEKALFVKIDADQNGILMQQFAIDEIPTYLVFKEGKLTMRAIGIQSESAFKEIILE